MIGAASLLQGQAANATGTLSDALPLDVLKRRVAHRRHTFAVQAVSYALGAAALLIYAHAGTIGVLIPAAFFLSGVTLIGVFTILSEAHVNDRFEDHYLTVFQVT